MARYNGIKITSYKPNTPQRYITTKYPEITKSFSDIYVYTTQGDRYDLLAITYYGDSSLWWIISTANYETSYDSIIPPIGVQIRIPAVSRIDGIISGFEELNNEE